MNNVFLLQQQMVKLKVPITFKKDEEMSYIWDIRYTICLCSLKMHIRINSWTPEIIVLKKNIVACVQFVEGRWKNVLQMKPK